MDGTTLSTFPITTTLSNIWSNSMQWYQSKIATIMHFHVSLRVQKNCRIRLCCATVCLCNSLTAEAYQTVFQSSSKFMVISAGPPSVTKGSGPTLLRYIVSRAVVDTLGSADTIKTKLMNLTSNIDEMDCDIKKFNKYVENQNNALIPLEKKTLP